MNQLCKTCRFWMPLNSELGGTGNCHRYPPRIVDAALASIMVDDPDATFTEHVESASRFPITESGAFCGEWSAETKTPG